MPLGLLRFIQCIIFGVRAFEPLTKLQLSLSQSLLTQELLGYEEVVSVKQREQPRNNLHNGWAALINSCIMHNNVRYWVGRLRREIKPFALLTQN